MGAKLECADDLRSAPSLKRIHHRRNASGGVYLWGIAVDHPAFDGKRQARVAFCVVSGESQATLRRGRCVSIDDQWRPSDVRLPSRVDP